MQQPFVSRRSECKKYILVNLDLILAAILAVGIWAILTRYAPGGPLSSDILLYMDAGINHMEQVFILNRYFHVFLEGFFLRAAPTPLIGFQIYWAFLIAATAFLIYYNARSFTAKSNLIHGLLALGIFFSVNYIATQAGVAGVDFTAMFMVMLIVTVYLISARCQHRSKWILGLLGLLFYLAFKTKETTLVSGLLFVGLGFQDDVFNFKVFTKNVAFLLAGILAGVIFFALLSWVMLGDPFFGLRPKEIYDYFVSYVRSDTGQAQREATLGNYYTSYLLQALYIPFILYLLSGVKPGTELDSSDRLVWWLPLAMTIFVSLSASLAWGPRFLMPAVALICVLAPQFLNFDIPNVNRERIKAGVLFMVGIIMLLVLRIMMRFLLPKVGMDNSLFLVNIYEPTILSIILAISFFWKRLSLMPSIIITVLIVALLLSPLSSNVKTMFTDDSNRIASKDMFYPYSAFSTEIHYTPKMKMLVSLDAWQAAGSPYSNANVDNTMELFNIFFDASSIRNNYTVDTGLSAVKEDILQPVYNYVLISMNDWKSIASYPQIKTSLESRFQVYYEPLDQVVLLKEK